MLLNSIFLIVILFVSNIYVLSIALTLFVIFILIIKRKVIFPEKKYYITLLISAAIIQLLYNQEGKVLYGNDIFAITERGVIDGIVSMIKIYGMMLISKNSNFRTLFNGRLKKQTIIFESVVKIIPEVLKMPKTLINPGKIVKVILIKVYKELRKAKE